MAVFLLFLAYILGLLGLAALVVPGIYPAVFEPIGLKAESSLYRFAMLLALIGMPFFLRAMALASWRAAGYTLGRREAWSTLGRGILIGVAIMLALTTTQWALDIRHFDPPEDKWSALYLLRYLVSGLISGLAVGLIEETFFRGLMHTGMRRRLAFWPTAVLTSLLYAALHFMKPAGPGDDPFDTANALRMIGEGLARIADSAHVSDSFVTLVVVGIFLSMVRERTGNILWAIGIHAGWVMIIKVTKYLTDATRIDGETSVWIGGYDHITGWMATIWLGTIAAIYWYRTRRTGGTT
jgi:membrane protease YdiL (CAAX protease family)